MTEGKYENKEQAQGHIDQICGNYKIDKNKLLEFDYWFTSKDKKALIKFMAKVKRDGFSNCDENFIDEEEGKFCWTPSKTKLFNGEMVIAEYRKYSALAKSNHCEFGGLVMGYRQPQNDN
jgi:hypothetical protein